MSFKHIIFLIFFVSIQSKSDECTDWITKLGIQDKSNCIPKCLSAETDLSTFTCPDKCQFLCEKTNESDTEYNLLKTYGLTEKEISYCNNNKIKCLQGYRLSWKAEKLCLTIYPQSSTNDESDACRHYTWSILMTKKIGLDSAESILNAHEDNPIEPENEKAMDLANNRLGLLFFSKFKTKNLTDEEILNSFKKQLKENKLIILKPKYKKTGGLP
ncbi:MAG: hypothetical protein KDD45_01105 [Bdellovibrionales bacterium]|nr:hypothetical protein [Bdellovibrionales bacterium]